MKVAIAEMYYPTGHKPLNENLLSKINEFAEIVLMDDGRYFSGENISHIDAKRIRVKPRLSRRIEIRKTLQHAKNLLEIRRRLRAESVDALLLLSFNVPAFGLVHRLFKGIRIIIMHHYDIDRMLQNPAEVRTFKRFMNQTDHIVLADFIGEGLITKTGIDAARVHVVDVPLLTKALTRDEVEHQRENLFVGLGRSNDENLIDALITLDKERSDHTINKVLLRSSRTCYNSTTLQVINDFLPTALYDKLLRQARACFICFPESFRLRYSGSIDDALSRGKVIICTDIPIGRHYAKAFPNNCLIAKTPEEFMRIAANFDRDFDFDEYERFTRMRSDERIMAQLKSAIMRG